MSLERSKVTPKILDIDRQAYAQQWSTGNAAQLEHGGHYAWMAGFLDDYHKVLEIGTGDGRGTLALLKQGHIVVGVDENPRCLKLAADRLKEGGYSVAYEARERRERPRTTTPLPTAIPVARLGRNRRCYWKATCLEIPNCATGYTIMGRLTRLSAG